MAWYDACSRHDVPDGRGWPVFAGGRRIAVFRDGGGLRAVDNVCRHVGSPIDDGLVEDGCVTCPWHGWRYELATGHLLTGLGPARGLRTYPVRTEGDRVLVEIRA